MPITVPDGQEAVGAVAAELLAADDGAEIASAILRAIAIADQPDTLDPDLWGPAPSRAEFAAAAARSERRIRQARLRVLEDSLSRDRAAAVLGVLPQQVSKLIAARDLLTLEAGRELRLPRWQFDPDTPKGRLEGIREVMHTFGGGVVTLSLWATRPNPALGRRTPAQALADGDVGAVVAAAIAGV